MELLKKKLSSRKFWAALIAFLGTLLLALFGDCLDAELVALLQKGITALCVYIGGESLVDAAAVLTKKGEN